MSVEMVQSLSARVGEKAPEFFGKAYVKGEFKQIKASDYRGKWIVLFFWPEDFTFVCPTEIKAFREKNIEFEKKNAQVIGCSVDSVHSHKAWVERDLGVIDFPLIGDMTKAVASMFGIVNKDGLALRATFIIDPDGVLQSATVNNLSVGRNVDETLRVLDAFQTGELCPVNWNKGQKTLGKDK